MEITRRQFLKETATGLAAILSPTALFAEEKPEYEIEFGNIEHSINSDGHNHYDHTRIIKNNTDIGITLTSGKIEFENSGYLKHGNCKYRIEAHREISFQSWFSTSRYPETAILTYSGKNDNNEPVTISKTLVLE